MLGGVADELEPDGGTALLRRRGVDGAHADVVGPGAVELGSRVCRQADGKAEAPRCRRGHVVLADVDVVGPDEDGQVGAVVDDQRDAQAARDRASFLEHREQRGIREGLLPQLDEVDAAAHGRLEEGVEVRARTRDQIEPRVEGVISRRQRVVRQRGGRRPRA